MLFAYDLVLVGELRGKINEKIELWRQVLEPHGFHLSRNEMEYMECKFSKRRANANLKVKIGDHNISQVM